MVSRFGCGWLRLVAVVSVLAMGLVGCGGSSASQAAGQRTLTVSAATSLTGAFDELARQFEAGNPGVTVKLNYGGSSDLAQQIVAGARVDVFASANNSTMDTVTKAGLVDGAPAVFVTNRLQIAVAWGNPKAITMFADLARPGVVVVVAGPQEPCGAATQKVEQVTGVMLHPVSEEPDVKSVLSKVTTGDADAGVVYVTDVLAANGQAQGVDFPEAAKAISTYPIAAVKNSPQIDLARKFLGLVEGPTGQRVLTQAGFSTQ